MAEGLVGIVADDITRRKKEEGEKIKTTKHCRNLCIV